MVTELKDLNDVGAGIGALDFALFLKDGESRDSKIDKRIEFGGLEGSTKQSIKLLSHACNSYEAKRNEMKWCWQYSQDTKNKRVWNLEEL